MECGNGREEEAITARYDPREEEGRGNRFAFSAYFWRQPQGGGGDCRLNCETQGRRRGPRYRWRLPREEEGKAAFTAKPREEEGLHRI
ncbi:hypothetical protein SAMN06265221_101260 [Paracoccus laeviglucosivorans]|uniref:Uncharacterized protein n=1 Tax=Paracoccus laeviglucosivorans TaxID=1197861 RepID=A0A521AQ84_9RHOB|nr:hypothetical protein SAMN06265221_101260 [Paracoccus laeviglucosivorans]